MGGDIRTALSLLICMLLMVGCATTGTKKGTQVKAREFKVEDLAKSDVDMVAEVQVRLTMELLQQLMGKLYLRNPREWRKGGAKSRQAAIQQVFHRRPAGGFGALQGRSSIEAVRLSFEEGYTGDRVLALIEGLRGMILAAYNDKQAFYITDQLDPQKLYNAARNLEIVVWKLNNSRDTRGALYLITNETGEGLVNLSFERLFGKLIALQDSMARVIAETTNRRIKSVIQSLASAVFLPI